MFSRYLTKFSIYFILIILLFYSNILYANCINFIPYYYTGKSHKIIENKEFCVKNFSEKNIVYKSDEFGARIISNYPKKPKKVYFGDSQLLGLDVNAKEHNFFSDNFSVSLHATPNNGPYEVLNLIIERKLPPEEVYITFNFSRDIFRINQNWNPSKYKIFSKKELEKIIVSRFKYNLTLMKKYFLDRKLTFKAPNVIKLRQKFSNKEKLTFIINLNTYFNILKLIKKSDNKFGGYYIYPPFWAFDVKGRKITALDNSIKIDYKIIVCSQVKNLKPLFSKIYVMDLDNKNLLKSSLTKDLRHIKTKDVHFKDINKFCA